MSEAFVGEIRMFGGTFAPAGFALCNGQMMSIAQNEALFALIGTTYGGDGQTTFALPDLRGRLPVGQGQAAGLSAYTIGQKGGTETVTLTAQQMPSHSHGFRATSAIGNLPGPSGGAVPATPNQPNVASSLYVASGSSTRNIGPMAPTSISSTAGGQPHDNLMPSLCVNFIIALQGIFPSRN